MTQQHLPESPEKTQHVEGHEANAASAQSFQGGLHAISQLQRTLGNLRVAQLIQTKRLTPEGKIIGLQRKLTVGAADDQYEQEADRVAHQVMNTPDAVATTSAERAPSLAEAQNQTLQTKPLAASITSIVQRQKEKIDVEDNQDREEEKDKSLQVKSFSDDSAALPLQRQMNTDEVESEPIQTKSAESMAGSFEAGADVETQLSHSKGRGSPLPDPVRTYMEPRFGVDFSQVNIHTDTDALQMNQAVGAQAFTHGSDIYFGEGQSPSNLELTAHELTHVMQQTGTPPLRTKKREEEVAPLGKVKGSTLIDTVPNETFISAPPSSPAVTLESASGATPGQDTPVTSTLLTADLSSKTAPVPATADQTMRLESAFPATSDPNISVLSGTSATMPSAPSTSTNGEGAEGNGVGGVGLAFAPEVQGAGASTALNATSGMNVTKGTLGKGEDIGGGIAAVGSVGAIGGTAEEGGAPDKIDGKARAARHGGGARLAVNLHCQEGSRSAPATGSAAVMPESPAALKAAELILQTVETEKDAFSQEVQAQRTAMLADAEGKSQAIATKTLAKTKAIAASIDSKKAEILSKFSEARVAIMAQMASRKTTAHADGDKALASLQKEVETKRKDALDSAEGTASQTEKTGQTETECVTSESNASAGRVNAIAATESNKYGDTPKGKTAAAQAIQKVAAELISKIRVNGSDQAKQAQETSRKAAQGFRDSGKQLAASLGGGTAQVEQTIRQSVEGAISRIDIVGKHQLATLTGLQARAQSSLETAKVQSIPAIQQAGKTAQAGALQAGEALAFQMDTLKATVLQQLTDGANRVLVQLRQSEQSRRFNGKAALEAAQGASEPLRQGRTQITSLLMEKVNAAQTQFGTLETTFGNEIDGAEQKLNGTLVGVVTSATSSLAQLQTELGQLFDQVLNSSREAQQKAVAQYGDGLVQKINEAKQKWGQERDKVQAGIRADIDKSLKVNQEAEQKAPAEFAKVGKEAAEEAEGSVLMGILKGIGKVLLGLVILFALAAIIYGVAALLAFLGVCAAIPFAIALAIAAVVLLIVMFVLAVIQRTKEMDSVLPADRSFWLCLAAGFAVVFIALGDMVGITPIIEGVTGKTAITQKPLSKEESAEKITEGVLTLLLLFIGGRLVKGLRKGDPVLDPLKGDPVVDPNKPVDPAVDPNKPVDPTVDPNKPADPTVDPNKPADPTVDPNKPADPTVDPNKPADPTVDPNKLPEPPKHEPEPPKTEPKPPEPKPPTTEVPKSWSKFKAEFHELFKARLKTFRGNDELAPDFGGGEGKIFSNGSKFALKRWFAKILDSGKAEEGIKLLEDAKADVDANPNLANDVEVVKIHEKGPDWILRDFDPMSVELRDGGSAAEAARTRAIAELEAMRKRGELTEVLKDILKKLKKEPPSANLHWSPSKGKIIVIDMR
jgi:hypothetical protein